MMNNVQVMESNFLNLNLPDEVELGEELPTEPYPRFQAVENVTYVINIITKKIKPFKLHTVSSGKDFLGYMHTADFLLKYEGMPKLYYAVPIVRYTVQAGATNMMKKGAYSSPYSFEWLRVSPSNYKKIITLMNAVEDVTAIDIMITVARGKQQYQDYIFTPLTNSAPSWRSSEKDLSDCMNLLASFNACIHGLIGKTITEAEYWELKEGGTPQQRRESLSFAPKPSLAPLRGLPSAPAMEEEEDTVEDDINDLIASED